MDEPICNLPKNLLINCGFFFLKAKSKSIAKINATENPNAGDTIINTSIFSVPENTIDSMPPEINAEPISPPTSA